MISVVIPVYNERRKPRLLHAEIVAVGRGGQLDVEMIFVDDGSKDGSWEVIARPGPQACRASTASAFAATSARRPPCPPASAHAHGDIVMTLDADLQDDPARDPAFPGRPGAAAARDGSALDVVSGWKQVRHDPWHKVWPQPGLQLDGQLADRRRLHDHNCGMKGYRAEVLREIRLYGELHRFIPVLAAARGFRVGEIVIDHRPRRFGSSKYGVWRFVKGFLDLLTVKFLTGFGQRPQHLLGGLGLVSFLLGSLGLFYLAVTWVINNSLTQHPDERRFRRCTNGRC